MPRFRSPEVHGGNAGALKANTTTRTLHFELASLGAYIAPNQVYFDEWIVTGATVPSIRKITEIRIKLCHVTLALRVFPTI